MYFTAVHSATCQFRFITFLSFVWIFVQPADIYEFSARYFSELIEQREAGRSANIPRQLGSAELRDVILGAWKARYISWEYTEHGHETAMAECCCILIFDHNFNRRKSDYKMMSSKINGRLVQLTEFMKLRLEVAQCPNSRVPLCNAVDERG